MSCLSIYNSYLSFRLISSLVFPLLFLIKKRYKPLSASSPAVFIAFQRANPQSTIHSSKKAVLAAFTVIATTTMNASVQKQGRQKQYDPFATVKGAVRAGLFHCCSFFKMPSAMVIYRSKDLFSAIKNKNLIVYKKGLVNNGIRYHSFQMV